MLADVMLALDMDGKPLSRPHGAPARVVMPQMYGYKSVKWVTRIEVRTDVLPGYWEQHGYDADAWLGRSNGLRPEPRRGRHRRTAPETGSSRASAAPSGSCTGRTRARSSSCSPPGWCCILPALSEIVARRQLVKNIHLWHGGRLGRG